jgi:FtsP/CotA-like multicopper oxidase with cupredoxin domain
MMMSMKRALLLLCGGFASLTSLLAQQQESITEPPEVRTPFTLSAIYDPRTGHNAFSYAGDTVPPVIRVLPGGVIKVEYENRLPKMSHEKCAVAPCMDMSNLHFHGLHVSPESPQDDVLTMISMPGETLHYAVEIPTDAPGGLYWYHTHPHGESQRQALDGMSGAIVIEGIDRYYPEIRNMRERILILRDRDIENSGDSGREQIKQVEISSGPCGTSTTREIERIFTLNGQIRPLIPISAGERQLWRIVNASPDRYADLQLDGQMLDIVALDGMPLPYHNPRRRSLKLSHILLPPAGRVEAIITGPPKGERYALRTRCVDTGPDGDFNPGMVVADVVGSELGESFLHNVPPTKGPPVYKHVSSTQIQSLAGEPPDFTVTFTEDKDGFYINGKKFSMSDLPMLRVHIGSYQHWRVVNRTRELHPFHIHQVHFLVYAENGVRLHSAEWLDTVNVPYGGSVDLIMDFTDPVIRGMSVFHCHLLNHEDKGMMAKILFE